jgi:hypothetical protein
MGLDLSLLGQREQQILFCLSPARHGVTAKELAVEIHGDGDKVHCDMVSRGLMVLEWFLTDGVRFDLRLDESEPEMVNRYQRKVRAYRLTHTAYVAVCAAAKSQEVTV